VYVEIEVLDTIVSFDAVFLFTKVQVDEALQVIGNKFHNDDTLTKKKKVCLAGNARN
jgi:hypothetical protein